ncbi:uncharacterized protein [Misgurnus anguillicaudatus]|uniref:uncharacterized protein isoform X2 n=1 Tax=Misgurnus anguillicaudatus TaxID=75329 RepID=UPI003CCF5489
MSKLQLLSVFLTDRLTLAAQEIFKAVEDIFSEYNEEICRSRKEIELLRRRLQQAGLQMDSETQSCSNEIRDSQTFLEEHWRCEQDGKDTEVQMKLEVYREQEENEVQTSVCNESRTLFPCVETDHDQMACKDIATQMMDDSENDFPFNNQDAHIKNEPGLYTEAGSTCQAQHFTRHSSDDPGESDTSSSNKTKIDYIDSAAHTIQEFNLPFRNQEMLMQQRMELAQIHERCSTEDQKKAASKARSLKHKQKVYGNPELREAYRRKERERYQRRKSLGKVKFAKDLNPLELRRRQKQWRENSAAYRRRKTCHEVFDNIKEDFTDIPVTMCDTSSVQNVKQEI